MRAPTACRAHADLERLVTNLPWARGGRTLERVPLYRALAGP